VGASSELGFATGLIQQVVGYAVSLPGLAIWIRGRSQPEAAPQPPTVPADPSLL
jgi:hypothetical protein